jgi:hypothetical protein
MSGHHNAAPLVDEIEREQDRYIAGDPDTRYKFEVTLRRRIPRPRTLYQFFFAGRGEVHDMLGVEDIEVAMTASRNLVFIFEHKIDLSVFLRRLPVFERRGYRRDDPRRDRARAPARPGGGNGQRVKAEMAR